MRLTAAVVTGIVTLWIISALLMHLAMQRHAVLEFDPEIANAAPGEALATSLSGLMSHELDSVTGWRPNDFFLWGPSLFADNNSNRQLGILAAIRETTRVFKDHLSKVSSDQYDGNLVEADTMFRNDPGRMWFPSAESRFQRGAQALRDYVAGLHATPPHSKPLNQRNIELIRLFQSWSDMLGDAHASLYRDDIGWLDTDDVFYHAQGAAHVMAHAMRALRVEYKNELQNRPILDTLFEEAGNALLQASTLKPMIVLDGGPASLFANHRRNLDAYVNEARQKMYSIREELEK